MKLGRRSPPAAWEGRFLIALLPSGWRKLQLFSGGRHPRRHCLSKIEGMDGPGRELLLADGAIVGDQPLSEGDFQRAADGWDVRTPRLSWTGTLDQTRLTMPSQNLEVVTRGGAVLWWARIPRVLSYFSAMGRVTWNGEEGWCLVEQAWGMSSRIDLARLVPRRWHWDVLAGPQTLCAGLGVGVGGAVRGLRSGGRIDGEGMRRGRGLDMRVHDWMDQHGRRVPARWMGRLRFADGTLIYHASANSPVAPLVPGGGFLGFAWQGEWRPADTPARMLSGTGFCEYSARNDTL